MKYRMDRFCDAIENGILPDDVAQEHSRKIQARRQAVLAEMAGLRIQQTFSMKDFGPKRINTFCNALRRKLFDKESNFGKEYVKLLIGEIRIEWKDVRMHGKYANVVDAMRKTALGFSVGLPRAGSVWLPVAGPK